MTDSTADNPDFPARGEADGAGSEPAEPIFAEPELEDDDFLPETCKPPGPGLLEALLWTFGTLVVHIIGSLAFYMYCSAQELERTGVPPDRWMQSRIEPEFVETIQANYLATLLAGEQLVFFLVVLLCAWARLRGARTRALPLRMPAGSHLGLTVLWVIPLAFFCGQLGIWVTVGWDWLIERLPSLKSLDGDTVMQTVAQMRESVPVSQLILWIAVLPAISEELVFRGVVGRGLVARYGLVAGVAVTSLLFAAVHLHPVHVLALLPLAVAIHVSYLATRSFLIPVLLHFLNNSWAVWALVSQDLPEPVADVASPMMEPSLPIELSLAAGACSLGIGLVIWKSRVVFRNADGDDWNSDRSLIDTPTDASEFRPVKLQSPARVTALCLASVLLFWGLFGYHATELAEEAEASAMIEVATESAGSVVD